MAEHPCLSCSLPDCDERSKDCVLRASIRSAIAKKASGIALTDIEVVAWGEIHVRNAMLTDSRAKARDHDVRKARRRAQEAARGTQEAARHA